MDVYRTEISVNEDGGCYIRIFSTTLDTRLHPDDSLKIFAGICKSYREPASLDIKQIQSILKYFQLQNIISENVLDALAKDLFLYRKNSTDRSIAFGCDLIEVRFPRSPDVGSTQDPVLKIFGIDQPEDSTHKVQADCIMVYKRPWEDEHWLTLHLLEGEVVYSSQE